MQPQQNSIPRVSGTEGASRVIEVLLLFLEENDCIGVSHISRELGLSKAVVHRILRSLVAKEMLIQDEATKLYQLGPVAAAIGHVHFVQVIYGWRPRLFYLHCEIAPAKPQLFQSSLDMSGHISNNFPARRK